MSDVIVDLEQCAREPIHIPGYIQPHGVLFVLREAGLQVLQVSENCEHYFGLKPDVILAQGLGCLLDKVQIERVQFALDSSDPTENNPVRLGLASRQEDLLFDGVVHKNDGFSFLELEATIGASQSNFLNFYKSVGKITSQLHASSSLNAMLQEAVSGVRQITGFDRVMIYHFSETGDGQVIAEAKSPDLEPYLGLWYPASDIPVQARRLYCLNPIRSIPRVDYTPVAIVPVINPESRRPVDLSFSTLRSVSPVHCEYLTNMGVSSSMSVSILREGQLWGLIACHHTKPLWPSYEVRAACTFLGQVISKEVLHHEGRKESEYVTRSTGQLAKFLELMVSASSPLLGLVDQSPNLMDLIPAGGVAVVIGDKVRTLGITPGYDQLLSLVQALRKIDAPSTFSTKSLQYHFPLMASITGTASGMIALEIARDPESYIFYFRPERSETVRWAGDPNKPVTPSESGYRLSPRKSFAAWKEKTHGIAAPWTKQELQAADQLRRLISIVSARKES